MNVKMSEQKKKNSLNRTISTLNMSKGRVEDMLRVSSRAVNVCHLSRCRERICIKLYGTQKTSFRSLF